MRDGAGELGGGFEQQDSGQEGLAGEVPAQERLVAARGVLPDARPARFQREQPVEKTKLRAMRQRAECVRQRVVHLLKG